MQDLSIVAVIPLYNGAGFIEEAIRSVLAQTLPPDEFVVVDDGSTDEGPEIVRRLAAAHPAIRLLAKPNGGQSSARNHGVARTTSALVALLDQDDTWYPDHLAELAAPFREPAPGIPLGWVYSDLDEVDRGGSLVSRAFLGRMAVEHPKLRLSECLRTNMYILPSASLIARHAFEAVGGFDEQLSGYEDDDLFLRLFRAGYRNVFLPQPLSTWRIYGTSTSFTPRMARSRLIFARKLVETYPDDPQRDHHFVRDGSGPRFLKDFGVDYLLAVRRGDTAAMAAARDALRLLVPSLTGPTALLLRLALPFMGSALLARMLWVPWRLARTVGLRRT